VLAIYNKWLAIYIVLPNAVVMTNICTLCGDSEQNDSKHGHQLGMCSCVHIILVLQYVLLYINYRCSVINVNVGSMFAALIYMKLLKFQ